ncbi:MAG TPA: biopolymer transporter ExbD [Candidatus Krumholzibacteria bacterium]|nr:biopolymer transporter ExbD [Candidatus Krumholzibacteria bacterium]HPD70470.1 biopolymer transporter ExbD [Candidatus Krumholzibacteria bacterium]HRY39830.1 biopolymer transporter ExbD [Candidatus Krumholzibacteria bacterium]
MKRWNESRESASGSGDINLTPLIDVSLTLVVILLLASPLTFESAFAVRRAAASAREAIDDNDQARIEVTILSADSLRVNRAVVPQDGLGRELAPLLERSPDGVVAVTCRDTVQHGTFVAVLDAIKLCGARDIAVAGR